MRPFASTVAIVALAWTLYAEGPSRRQDVPVCDPSYPTLCIPVGSPDLDCKDITTPSFPVLRADPHAFDADHDGLGCEPWPRRVHRAATGKRGWAHGTGHGFGR